MSGEITDQDYCDMALEQGLKICKSDTYAFITVCKMNGITEEFIDANGGLDAIADKANNITAIDYRDGDSQMVYLIGRAWMYAKTSDDGGFGYGLVDSFQTAWNDLREVMDSTQGGEEYPNSEEVSGF